METLTAVPGLEVGHATDPGGRTGCTVVVGPFRGAVDVRGVATGTRELDVLSPLHLVPRVDAILFTGGSAFGLSAAGGVVAWLEERGRGFDTRAARVPIVPAAVIYDLEPGKPRPDASMGSAACEAASRAAVAQGRLGAGAGAMVGKITGLENAMPGGLGSAAARTGAYVVGALAVVNALGDVLDGHGGILAGARTADERFLNTARYVREQGFHGGFGDVRVPSPGEHTTLALVATDAPLSRMELARVARMASAGVARRISPVFSPFDGDITIAVSTAPAVEDQSPGAILTLGAVTAEMVELAIERAVTAGDRG